MRPGGATCAPAQPDHLALADGFALFHLELGEVQIKAQQALPVVHHHEIALKKHGPGQQHRPTADRPHGRPGGDGIIEPLMPALHFVVENSSCAKYG